MKSKIVKPQSMYWAAAGFSLIGVLAHEALGAPMVLPPLLETDLPPDQQIIRAFVSIPKHIAGVRHSGSGGCDFCR